MRAVAYSIRSFEKEPLAKANRKKHDITLISNPLGLETAEYADGKEAVIISGYDHISETVLMRLVSLGVKFISVRSMDSGNIDMKAANKLNIKVATVDFPTVLPASEDEFATNQHDIAVHTIRNLDTWQANKTLAGSADQHPDSGFLNTGPAANMLNNKKAV